jgi:hypothetical protein
MQLYDNWKQIALKAWSIRLMILAGLLSGAEVALPYFASIIPPGSFAIASAVVTACAMVARVVVQKNV